MNIYTQVGLLTLVGLITKHGILMVEFANELQLNEGLDQPLGDRDGGPHPAASDPDDDGGDGHGPVAAADRDRRRRRAADSRSASWSSPACRSARCSRCSCCRRSMSAIATDHQAKAGSDRTKEIADFDLGRQALKPT